MCRFQTVLSRIAAADSMELTNIVLATLERYAVLFPDTEVLYLSVPKGDREERLTVLRSIVAFEEQRE